MLIEFIKFVLFAFLIVLISKYILVTYLRKLAESLNLKAKTVGNIAGISTSVPEFLSITTSSIRGLPSASVYNILSSNIINLIQYLATIMLNKNTHKLKNRAIIIDMIFVAVTIFIPIILLRLNIKLDMFIVPLFLLFYALFSYLNNSIHKLYLDNEIKENTQRKIDVKKIVIYIITLAIKGIMLYIVGELLGNSLENLCKIFDVPQFVVGILLGLITSIPELLTFFESQQYNKKEKDEMLGVVEATNNLVASNTLNLFVIQTIGILILNR